MAQPHSGTMNRRHLLPLVLLMMSCSSPTEPMLPQPNPPGQTGPRPAEPVGSIRLSGVVTDNSGAPHSRADIYAYSTRSQSGFARRSTADERGRYEINGVRSDRIVIYAVGQGFRQPCIRVLEVEADAEIDLELTSRVSPAPSRRHPLLISGTVYRSTSDVRKPVSGVMVVAHVDIYSSYENVGSTWTDANGKYLICGVPLGETVLLSVAREDNSEGASSLVKVTGNLDVDFELK